MVPGKIFYYALVNSPQIELELNATLHIGPAWPKVRSVLEAINLSGRESILVTCPLLKQSDYKRRSSDNFTCRTGNFDQIVLASYKNRILRKISALIGFALHAFSVDKKDKVILYNSYFEYLVSLIILRIRGVRVFLDIEDGPLGKSLIQTLIQKVLLNVFMFVADVRKLVASHELAEKLNLSRYYPLYGFFIDQDCGLGLDNDCVSRIHSLKNDGYLIIHFGGSLRTETGLDIFLESLLILNESVSDKQRIAFVITGFGGRQAIQEVIRKIDNDNLKLLYLGELPVLLLDAIVKLCEVGLNLKLSKNELSSVTFPSKVVSIVSQGRLLITTRISDLPLIFQDDEVIFLNDDATELADVVLRLERDRCEVSLISAKGKKKAQSFFSPETGARNLVEFLKN